MADRSELAFHRDSDRSEQQREVGVPQADRSAGLSDPDRLLRSGRARVSVFVPLHSHQIQHDRKVGRSLSSLRSVADFDSSFTQDLTRISWLSKAVSERSLVLIDEFGKGTAPQGSIQTACSLDGIALFLSSLVHIHTTQPPHSLFMLSTHFSDYLEHEILQPLHTSLTFKQMNVILDTENGGLVTPLFQVVEGVCQDSLGIRCARAFGMPSEVTERAQQVRIELVSRVDLRLHPRGQGSADCAELDRSEEGGAD